MIKMKLPDLIKNNTTVSIASGVSFRSIEGLQKYAKFCGIIRYRLF
jgi:hypothetical protein